jgi:hypothetical protein
MNSNKSQRVYRVDRFVVPAPAREEFLEKALHTQKFLRSLPGFLQDFVLEQSSENGEIKIVTIVEWENMESVERAKPVVMAMHKEIQFNPAEMFTRLGIKSDQGYYSQMDF